MDLKSRLRNLLIFTAPLIASVGHAATTFYVSTTGNDANPGTISRPMATISQASRMSGPGDTICLRAGMYKWNKQQIIFSRGTAAAPLTVTSYPYEGVTIDGYSMPANTDSVVGANPHIVVKFIQFNNGRRNNLSFWNLSDIKVIGCGFGSAVQSGLMIGSSTLNGATGFTIDKCKFYNNCVRNAARSWVNWQPAIQLYQIQNATVSNCMVKENWAEGIGLCTCTDVNVVNNDVSDNYSVNIYLDNALRVNVKNNRVFNLGDPRFFREGRTAGGVVMASEPVTYPLGIKYCNISNNVITNCYSGIWWSDYGLAGGMQGVVIKNNTVWGKENAVIRIDADPNHSANVLQNNVFYQAAGRFVSIGDASVGVYLGHNCWYGANPGNFWGVGDLQTNPLLSSPGTSNLSGYSFLPLSLCPAIPCGADISLVGKKS